MEKLILLILLLAPKLLWGCKLTALILFPENETSLERGAQVDYGTFFLSRLGGMHSPPFYIPRSIIKPHTKRICDQVFVVFTDNFPLYQEEILEWVNHERYRLKLQEKSLRVVSGGEMFQMESPPPNKPPSGRRFIRTQTPTLLPTPKPIVTKTPTWTHLCTERRSPISCLQEDPKGICSWFGRDWGCHRKEYCGFTDIHACFMQSDFCSWHKGKCVKRIHHLK